MSRTEKSLVGRNGKEKERKKENGRLIHSEEGQTITEREIKEK